MPTVERYDRSPLPRVRVTGAGALRIPASVSRTGVQVYRSGSEEWGELRLPEEVFDPVSIATLAGVPVTIAHEGGMVGPANWRKYAHGHAADRATVEDPWLKTELTVSSVEALDRVQRRDLVEISGGYTCELEPRSGYHEGQPYKYIQRKIRWNHVSLLPRGHARAGSDARLHFDSISGQTVPQAAFSNLRGPMTITTFRFDAAKATAQIGDRTYSLSSPGEITSFRRDANALMSSFKTDMADPEQIKAKVDELMGHATMLVEGIAALAEITTTEANTEPTFEEIEQAVGAEVMDKAVAKRAAIVAKADALGIETKNKASAAIIREVLSKRGVRCDGKDDRWLVDVFDRLPETTATFDSTDRNTATSGSPGRDDSGAKAAIAAARKLRAEAWKRKSA